MARAATALFGIDGVEEVYVDTGPRPAQLVVRAQPGTATPDQMVDAVYVALLEDPGYTDPPVVEAIDLGGPGAEVVAALQPVDRSPQELVAFAEENVAVLTAARFT